MSQKIPKRHEFDKKFFAKAKDGIIIGKTNSDSAHLTILFKEGRVTIHTTRTVEGKFSRPNLY